MIICAETIQSTGTLLRIPERIVSFQEKNKQLFIKILKIQKRIWLFREIRLRDAIKFTADYMKKSVIAAAVSLAAATLWASLAIAASAPDFNEDSLANLGDFLLFARALTLRILSLT